MSEIQTPTMVTQADRALLKSLLEVDDELADQIDRGLAFTGEAEQIARHRIAALEKAARVAENWPDRIEGVGIAYRIRALIGESE